MCCLFVVVAFVDVKCIAIFNRSPYLPLFADNIFFKLKFPAIGSTHPCMTKKREGLMIREITSEMQLSLLKKSIYYAKNPFVRKISVIGSLVRD